MSWSSEADNLYITRNRDKIDNPTQLPGDLNDKITEIEPKDDLNEYFRITSEETEGPDLLKRKD